jgi:hypothetical protein
MSKETPFFKFDASDWLAGSIQFVGFAEKGLFIDLCALYWKNQKPIKIDAKFKVRYRDVEGALSNLIATLSNLEIIKETELGIVIPFLDRQLEIRKEWVKKCSDAGKKSRKPKGSLSNKKEERRKKKEDSRDKIVEKSKDERIRDFSLLAQKENDKLSNEELNNFISYWTESGINDKKLRFEKEKSFGVKRRISTWASRSYNNKTQKQTNVDIPELPTW